MERINKNQSPSKVRRWIRSAAEQRLARTLEISSDLAAKNPGEIIQELLVEQIELEIQNEELKKGRLMLEESRDRYLDRVDFIQSLFRDIPASILVHQNGIIQYANPAISTFLHAEINEIIGSHVITYVAPSSHAMVETVIQKRDAGEEILPYEITVLTREGDSRICEVRETPVCYGGDIASLIVLTDVTERRHAEYSLRQANQKLRLLSSLTRHDVFNHLTEVYMFHELALSEHNSDAISHSISMAQESCTRIEHIIEFTREYDDFGVMSSGWHQISGVIDSAIPDVILGSIRIDNQTPRDLMLYSDSIIRRVFSTLADNAIRHGGQISTIRFSCKESDDTLIIICEDDGRGIAESEKDLIFTQGYGEHTGIGLFMSREILSITGLSIRECGEEGKGARFEIIVPSGKYRWAAMDPADCMKSHMSCS